MADKQPDSKSPTPSESKNIPEKPRSQSTNTSAMASSPRSGFIPPSPPRFISMEELMNASNLISNMKLAHEIAVDDEFKIEKPEPPNGSLEKLVTDTMRQAFWDALREKLSEQPPDYRQAIVLISEVKEKLMGCLLQRHETMRQKINEVLDMQLIEQEIENDAFDIKSYAIFVQEMMSRLCAPVRDEDVAKIKEIDDVILLFKEIFRILDVMLLDMANAQILQMRPYLKQQSIQYERKKFEEFLQKQEESGIDGLEYTREWLERSHDLLEERTVGQEVFHTNIGDVTCTPANILHGAFMELLNWSDEIFPESCLMDQQRFLDIAFNLRRLTLTASILVVTFNTVGDSLSGHTQFRDQLKSEILAILSDTPESQYSSKIINISEHISTSVNKELTARGYAELKPEAVEAMKERISSVVEPNHSVYTLLWKRVMTFIFKSMGASSSSVPLQLPQGLGSVSQEVASYCGKFLKLSSHNKAVFAHRYADIIGTLMQVTDLSPRQP